MNNLVAILKSDRLFTKAQKLANEDRLDEAITAYEKALLLTPASSGLNLHKALALSDKGNYTESMLAITKTLELDNNNHAYHFYSGRIQYDYGLYDKALEEFDRSLSIYPDNELVICYQYLTRLTKEYDSELYKNIRKEIIKTNSDFQSRVLLLCESFLGPENIRLLEDDDNPVREEPLSALERVIINVLCFTKSLPNKIRFMTDKQKKLAYTHYIEGVKQRLEGNNTISIEEFKKALQLLNGLEDALRQIAELYYEMGDYPSALEYFGRTREYSRAIELLNRTSQQGIAPDILKKIQHIEHSTLLTLGNIYFKLQDYRKAITIYEVIVKAGWRDFEVYYYLGSCYLALDNKEKARFWYKKATEKPGTSLVRDRLDQMDLVHSNKTQS
jgi:tetratricopeptide (TPR) repeat protein